LGARLAPLAALYAYLVARSDVSPGRPPQKTAFMMWRTGAASRAWPLLEAAARKTLAASPATPGPWLGLGEVLRQQGRAQEAAEMLRKGMGLHPESVRLRTALADVLRVTGAYEQALDALDAALRLDAGCLEARRLRLRILLMSGRREAAQTDAEAVARVAPADPLLLDWHAARARADPSALEGLLAAAETVLAARPACTAGVHYKALALARLGRSDEAQDLIRLDRLAELGTIALPNGFASRADFHAALTGEILADPTLEEEPRGKATARARQTRQLQPSLGAATAGLLESLRDTGAAAADAIAARCPAFGRGRPDAADLRAWAVVCGPEGHQKSHWHPEAWASGVYYVSAPADPAEGFAGPLLLGSLEGEGVESPPWGIRLIAPEPGRLVVFPSYLPHATAPSRAERLRISVAFDIVPAG
jgi:tetratricopeptide (TPR) repeat protein